jgi:hypothetical protein
VSTSQPWIDKPAFTFADVVRLTGYKPSRIHGYVVKKQFRPQYPQPQGGAFGVERRTYTGRDVLRLLLLGPAVRFGVHLAAGDRNGASQPTLDALKRDLDAHIDAVLSGTAVAGANERVVFPRLGGPWCYLVLDLAALAETQTARIAEYRRVRDEGVGSAKTLKQRKQKSETV